MILCKTLALLLLLYRISLAPQRSTAASLVQALRILGQQVDTARNHEMSPSPSPDPGIIKSIAHSSSGEDKDVKSPAVLPETCETDSNKCHYGFKNVTACILPYVGYGIQELLVLNDGDRSLKLNVTVPAKSVYNDTEIPGHGIRKMNVSSNAIGSSSFVLSADNWTCTIQIHRGVPVPSSFPSYYAAYVTPINSAYLLIATAILMGGMWACCKFSKEGRHLDGVPYQELEMGQQESSASINVETADGWDQSWDDDWDEERAVKSPGGNYRGNGRANGVNGWGNE